jgi:hypothetical protein
MKITYLITSPDDIFESDMARSSLGDNRRNECRSARADIIVKRQHDQIPS